MKERRVNKALRQRVLEKKRLGSWLFIHKKIGGVREERDKKLG